MVVTDCAWSFGRSGDGYSTSAGVLCFPVSKNFTRIRVETYETPGVRTTGGIGIVIKRLCLLYRRLSNLNLQKAQKAKSGHTEEAGSCERREGGRGERGLERKSESSPVLSPTLTTALGLARRIEQALSRDTQGCEIVVG